MKLYSKIYKYDCQSLEEMIRKRDYLRKTMEEGEFSKKLEEIINKLENFKKHIEIEIIIDDLCEYLIFDVKNTCDKIENIRVKQRISGQLSNGLFENFNCFDWEVKK